MFVEKLFFERLINFYGYGCSIRINTALKQRNYLLDSQIDKYCTFCSIYNNNISTNNLY